MSYSTVSTFEFTKIRETIMAADSIYRITEVVKLAMVVKDGKVSAYRARVALSFKYDPKR